MAKHIVMLPFMAQGHLIPFLALAKKLQEITTGFTITIANTPLNIKHLRTAISKDHSFQESHRIQLKTLPFNSSDHGLPPNTENTESLPLHKIIELFASSASLEAPFRDLISDITAKDRQPPVCIISDIFMGWANDVAKDSGIYHVSFTTGGAYGTAAYVSLWQHLPHRVPGAGDEFKLPGFPDSYSFHTSQLHPFLRNANGSDPWSKFFQLQLAKSLSSFGMLCNTAEEVEPFGLDVLRKYIKLPVWCIGPLLPPQMLIKKPSSIVGGQRKQQQQQHSGREPGLPSEKCLEWLDRHCESSVLYISFGSQNTISPSQMMALAMGLEESGKPFIWCIRPPVGFDLKGEFRAEWLPEGFEKRMRETGKGLMVHGWAPQLDILCHKSTGAFLSHCGWNSVMESLSQGVPIIGWPLAGEQGYNSKMLTEDMGVCVELCRGTQSNLGKEEVKKVIYIVLEKGDQMKKKADEIGELIRAAVVEDKGSSPKAINDFISVILSHKSNK